MRNDEWAAEKTTPKEALYVIELERGACCQTTVTDDRVR
jgi:hypothetical protein